MAKYTRVSRHEFPSTDPTRIGQMDVAYVYHDELFQTVAIRFPLAEDSPEKVREELRKRAAAADAGGEQTVEI